MSEIFRSTGKLEKLSMAELVELYNSISSKRAISKFSSQAAGVQRCLKLLAKQSRETFNYPCGKGGRRKPNPGTRSELVLIYLHKGATVVELQSLTGWSSAVVCRALRALHFVWGHGMVEDTNGVIKLRKA